MPTYTLAPYAYEQFFDDNGNPLSGGLLYTYASGTATLATTYRTGSGTTNANPIVLDSAGRCVIYLAPTSYKFILKNSAGVAVGPTMDPVTAVGAGSSGLGEAFVFGGQSSFPVTSIMLIGGATYDKLQPGTAVFTEDSANLTGTYILRATGLVSGGGVTLVVALVNLSDGAPDTPLATLTITSTTGEVANSTAISWGLPGTVKQYGIKTYVTGNEGYCWGITLIKTA